MSSTSNSRAIAWTVWIIASIFYAYQYILRVIPNVMLSDIMQQFGISAATFGQFSGVYYIGYSLMHLPIGIMLDRYGAKKVMSSCILTTVIGLLPLIYSEHWVYPVAGRFLIGIGSSAAILGLFKIIRITFSEERFPRMLSLSVMIGLIGAIYGGGPISYFREVIGYQTTVEAIAIAGILLAIITYFIIPETKATSDTTVFSNIKEVVNNRKVLCCCICAGLMVGPLEGFADVWGTIFLKNVYGLESTLAASMTSTIFMGMCFGAPLLSLIADKVRSYLGTIIAAGFAMAVSFAVILIWHPSSAIVSINFLLIGICCSYQILAIYKASTYVREEVAGLTTAVANMIIMIFGYVFHTILGEVIHAMGGPNVAEALTWGTAVIPITLCLGSCGFIALFLLDKASSKEQVLQAKAN